MFQILTRSPRQASVDRVSHRQARGAPCRPSSGASLSPPPAEQQKVLPCPDLWLFGLYCPCKVMRHTGGSMVSPHCHLFIVISCSIATAGCVRNELTEVKARQLTSGTAGQNRTKWRWFTAPPTGLPYKSRQERMVRVRTQRTGWR